MTSRLALLSACFVACAGCALVSGLSKLDVVGDGGSSPPLDGGDATVADADGGDAKPGIDAKPDGITVADASPDAVTPHPPGVLCGSSTMPCKPSDECCRDDKNVYACTAVCAHLEIRCDDWSDCGGSAKVCCVSMNVQQTDVVEVRCEEETTCAGKAILCDPGVANPCPGGRQCSGPPPIGLSSIYLTCK